MSSMKEMIAIEEQINLPLLNDIIVFVADTAKADYTQQRILGKRCMLLSYEAKSSEFQQKYGFLYLGELLERYEGRFGMSDQDRRAIALALGYTKHIVTDEMFVGNQRDTFLRELSRNAGEDIYLTGALYLLNEGQSSETDWLNRLYDLGQGKVEELIFAMSVLPDFEQAFLHYKEQLIYLLGHGRTMALQDNMRILSWLIAHLRPVLKAMRGADLALLRALCALPVSFVKEGSKHHKTLLEHGYTPFEIAYANIMAVRCQAEQDTLNANSMVTEKIVIDLFKRALIQEEPFSPEMYTLFSELFIQYMEFPIRCYGYSGLLEALEADNVTIQNADTFIWCSKYAPVWNPLFAEFDILEHKWDSLGTGLPENKYLDLFEDGLDDNISKVELQRHIDRYDAVTGSSYLALYRQKSNCQKFSLLVETGILDLWTEFQASIDENGVICLPEMIGRIRAYVCGLKTVQAFRFFDKFLGQYGLDGYQRYFRRNDYDGFLDGLIKLDSSETKVYSINLEREYLKGDTQATLTLLYWLEEYLFQYRPSAYIHFICKLIQNGPAMCLIPQSTLRSLFDLVIDGAGLNCHEVDHLKELYWTPGELQAEAAAKEAAAVEETRKRKLKLHQDMQNQYEKETDGTLAALYKFLVKERYNDEKQALAEQIAYDHLSQLLSQKEFVLETSEVNQFLQLCTKQTPFGTKLVCLEKMHFTEAQNYISQIKEAAIYGAENNTNG